MLLSKNGKRASRTTKDDAIWLDVCFGRILKYLTFRKYEKNLSFKLTFVKTSRFKSNQPRADNFKGSLKISKENFSI